MEGWCSFNARRCICVDMSLCHGEKEKKKLCFVSSTLLFHWLKTLHVLNAGRGGNWKKRRGGDTDTRPCLVSVSLHLPSGCCGK